MIPIDTNRRDPIRPARPARPVMRGLFRTVKEFWDLVVSGWRSHHSPFH